MYYILLDLWLWMKTAENDQKTTKLFCFIFFGRDENEYQRSIIRDRNCRLFENENDKL
jgi:hypothetical protein